MNSSLSHFLTNDYPLNSIGLPTSAGIILLTVRFETSPVAMLILPPVLICCPLNFHTEPEMCPMLMFPENIPHVSVMLLPV